MPARPKEPCSRCASVARVQARVDGLAVCAKCERRWLSSRARCSSCGQVRRPARDKINRGFCEPCAGITSTQVCGRCGVEEKLYATRRCTNCFLIDEVDRMRAGGDPTAVAQLDSYLTALAQARPANSALHWLRISRTSAAPVLRDLVCARRPITHAALDELPDRGAISFLRAALVRHHALPERDETEIRFTRWLEQTLEAVANLPDRRPLQQWSTWVVLHDLRTTTTNARSDRPHRTRVRVTIAFLRWLDAQDKTLATADQLDVDRWLAEGAQNRPAVRGFLDWAAKAGLATRLQIDRPDAPHSGRRIPDADRLALVARLADDDTLELRTRVAGLLIFLYGQPLARVARMRVDQIHRDDNGRTVLRLGRDELLLPGPVDELALRLAAAPQGRTLHDNQPHHWLFPGQRAGEPITVERLRRALRKQLGPVSIRHGRTGALLTMLADVPPSVLADLLGFSHHRAQRWSELAGSSYATYAATRLSHMTTT